MGFIQAQFGTSLDSNCQSSTWKSGENCQNVKKSNWSKKQRRAYSRILSGVKRCQFRGKDVYFLTLTSGKKKGFKDLAVDWDLFVKRVKRDFNVNFEFFKVTTMEGNGVIHALIHSCFEGLSVEVDYNVNIEEGKLAVFNWKKTNRTYEAIHAYFSTLWEELHEANIVWCRACYTVHGRFTKLAAYLTNQYVAGQAFCHMGYSFGWVFRGFCRKFYGMVHDVGFREALRVWDDILRNYEYDSSVKVQFPIGF